MSRYKVKPKERLNHSEDNSGYESGYESDEGTEYTPEKLLGSGEYAVARLFKSRSNKKIAVLNPVNLPGDIGEAIVKHRFFQTVYPEKKSDFFNLDTDYRLVIPYIEYVSYDQLDIENQQFLVTLFHSAAQAIKDCHNKGLTVLDLKTDGIYFDDRTKKSHLIDGGLSVPTGTVIDPNAFQKLSQAKVDEYASEYAHIPPECWSVYPNPVFATHKMDVYCLGILMQDLPENPSAEIQTLIDNCLEKNPDNRPTLDELLISLELLQNKIMAPSLERDTTTFTC